MKKLIIFLSFFLIFIIGINVFAEELAKPTLSVYSNDYSSIKIEYDLEGYTNFEIYRSTNNKKYYKIKDTTEKTYIDRKLGFQKRYYYRIKAYNIIDSTKIYSYLSEVKTTKPSLNKPVVTSTPTNSGVIQLSYKVAGASRYEIYRSTNNKDYRKIATTKYYQYTDKKLKANTTYYYRVRSYRQLGFKKYYSSLGYATVLTLPSIPALNVKSTASKEMNIQVLPTPASEGYIIYRSTKEKGSYTLVTTTSDLTYVDTSLKPGEIYYYKVQAYKNINGKIYKTNLSKVTSAIVKMDAPVINVTDAKSESIKINYNQVAGTISGYEIYRSTDGTNFNYSFRTTNTNYINKGLISNTTYYYKVRAFRSANRGKSVVYSDYSNISSLETKPGIPKINLVSNKDSEIKLIIASALGAENYEFYRKSATDTDYVSIPLESLEYIDTNVSRGTTYYYKSRSYKTVNDEKIYSDYSEIKVVCGSKIVYLTFDDGPSSLTGKLLDVLKKYNVKATFFVTAQGSSSNDKYIKRAYNEGHTIGLHTYKHNYRAVYSSVNGYFNDLNKISDKVYKLTNHRSKIIRFPGGSSNTVSKSYSRGIMTRLSKEVTNRGYYYFDWNVSSGDTGTTSTSKIYNNVIKGLKTNKKYYVVLQHDIKKASVNAVESIIKWGLNNGYTFAPLETSSPTVHHGINN